MAFQRKEYQCEVCDVKFLSGKWYGCCENVTLKHQVAARTFYSESAGNVQCLIKPTYGTDPATGQGWSTPGKQQRFVNGQYVTTDPEEVEKLEQVLAGGGLITREKYIDLKTTAEQRTARAQAEAKEANRLLAEAQEKLKKLEEEKAKLAAELPPPDQGASLGSKRRIQPGV